MLGGVELLNPAWLWAAPLVLIPAAAHLFARGVQRTAVFPAARFVREAHAGRSRWARTHHRWLMALRTVMLVALIAAFCRPVWSYYRPGIGTEEGIVTVLVVDRSASMRRIHRGATLFDEARRRAIESLRALDPNLDLATVILLDANPKPLLPRPTADAQRLIELLESVEPSYEHGDAAAALAIAKQQHSVRGGDVDGSAIGTTRVEVYSDMQASQWTSGLLDEVRRGVDTLQVDQIHGPILNAVLRDPAVSPAQPAVGQSVEVVVEAHCFSIDPDTQLTAHVNMSVNAIVQTQSVSLGPDAPRSVRFSFTPVEPGVHDIRFQMHTNPDDGFDADNAVGIALTIAPFREVLLLTESDPNDSNSAAYYVARALVPDPAASAGVGLRVSDTTGVALRVGSPLDSDQLLQADSTAAPAAMLLVEAGAPGAAVKERVRRYLIDGGSVIWVLDHPDVVAAVQQLFHAIPPSATTPQVLTGPPRWTANTRLTWSPATVDGRITEIFNGSAMAGLIAVSFRDTARIAPAPTASVPMVFSDGSPAVVVSRVGKGSLTIIAANLAPDASTLVKTSYLLPLIHELLRGASTQSVVPRHRPGEQPTLRLPPDGRRDRLTGNGPGGRIALDAHTDPTGVTSIRFPPIIQPGRYEVRETGAAQPHAAFYAHIDPTESDWRVDHPTVHPSSQRQPAATPIGPKPPQKTARRSTELWPWFIGLLAALVVAEPILSRPLRTTRLPARPRPTHAGLA